MNYKFLKILIFIFLTNFLFAQNKLSNWSIQISSGYTTFNPAETIKYFKSKIENFSRYNIPIKSQINYPGNIIWNGKIIYYLNEQTSLNLGASFTQTSAYSLYEDYAGTIDIVSHIKLTDFSLGIKQDFFQDFIFNPFISLSIGYSIIGYSLNQKFVFTEFDNLNSEISESQDGSNLKVEFGTGFFFELGQFEIGSNLNYRMAKFDVKNAKSENLEIDMSGMNYLLYIQFNF